MMGCTMPLAISHYYITTPWNFPFQLYASRVQIASFAHFPMAFMEISFCSHLIWPIFCFYDAFRVSYEHSLAINPTQKESRHIHLGCSDITLHFK